ncbi:MAG: hypothetical protein ACXVHL_33400 [Solirubrobacteraceae bacterium]
MHPDQGGERLFVAGGEPLGPFGFGEDLLDERVLTSTSEDCRRYIALNAAQTVETNARSS